MCDHNVDAAVATALRRRGHDAWSAADAGLALEEDDALTVYADEKRAALLTHDNEFSKRRKKNVVGQHVYLTCSEEDAADAVTAYLSELLPLLERGRDISSSCRSTASSTPRAGGDSCRRQPRQG